MIFAIGRLQALTCVFILSVFSFLSCTEKEYSGEDPAEAFVYARKPYDEKNYDIAVKKLDEFKSRFPYSKHAAMADMFIANSHFELEEYEEAAISYINFIKLHPKHEQVPYAMFRVGESYWANSPEEIDRDQEYAQKAIFEWQKLIDRFPQDENSAKAKKLIEEGKKRIALSQEFATKLYCKLKVYHACAYRSLQLLKKFPEFEQIRKTALKNAALSFEKLAEIKEKDPESDKNIFFKTMTAAQMREKAAQLKAEVK
jgi:outer membrane protein assembly factor BamD